MKRLLLSIGLLLVSTAAFAQFSDRDVLVAPEGTVYTVESQTLSPSQQTAIQATRMLALTVQNGSHVSQVAVPDAQTAGFHFGGALAYDADTKTLFVIWIHMPNAMSSELLLASYRDGKWQPAVSIDDKSYNVRSNLQIGITRHVSQLQKDGTYSDAPALLLHAVWWDESGQGEEARYALLPVENGSVAESAIETHSLEEFVPSSDEANNVVDANFNAEILRHPAIVGSAMQSTVDIVFGDIKKNSIHTVTLHPISDHRIHIPVGIGGGSSGSGSVPHTLSAPPNFTADWKGPINVLSRGNRLVFASAGEKLMSYISYSNGAWTDVKTIAIGSSFSAEAALAALDKMVSTQ